MASHEAARLARAAKLRGIYAIVNEDGGDTVALAEDCLTAGIGVVQYRAKRGIVRENLRAIRDLSKRQGALLILNDDWRAAVDFDCDGVHVGPGDDGFEHPGAMRAALAGRLVGFSCGTSQEADMAQRSGADYIGVGAVFATGSKDDAGAPIGIGGLQKVAASTELPVAAIGGITIERLGEVRAAGAKMAAVIGAIANAADPGAAARALVARWNAP